MLLTPAGLATAAGQLWVSTAANAGAMRTPTFGHTSGTSTTAAVATFGDLAAGAGPTTGAVVTGISVITAHGAALSNSTSGASALMSWACSGATTIAASASNCIRAESTPAGAEFRMYSCHFTPGLTAGSNTFTAKYTTGSGGTMTAKERHILVFPL